jgi:uncharacterized protein YjbI with pentapeptide repeats
MRIELLIGSIFCFGNVEIVTCYNKTSMKISSPEIEDELTTLDIAKLVPSAYIEGALIERQETASIDARNAELEGSRITYVTIPELLMQGVSMKDVFLNSTNLTAAKISDSKLIRVVFKGCRLQGIDFSASELSDIVFEDCNLDLSNFNMAVLQDVMFKNCSLNDASVVSSGQKNVAYENCVIEKIDITETVAQNVNLVGSQVYNITGMQSLKGFMLDMSQVMSLAPEFAIMHGIKIQR